MTILLLLTFLVFLLALLASSAAFVFTPAFTSTITSTTNHPHAAQSCMPIAGRRSCSPSILQAKGTKGQETKTKKAKKKILAATTTTRGGLGGGAGFGGITTTSITTNSSGAKKKTFTERQEHPALVRRIMSAADVAKLNTLLTQQRESLLMMDKEDEEEEQPPPTPDMMIPEVGRKTRRQKWSQRSDAVETVAEITRLKHIYTQEYHHQHHQQQELETKDKNNMAGQLVQVSTNPLIFTIDEFIDPEKCRRVKNNADGCFDLLFPERLSDLVFDGQESEMDGLLFNTANSREHDDVVAHPYHFPDGLHMDTNNQCMFRHVTCILYLNDIPEECGGATVFPLARTLPDDPALAAARRLLDHKLSHTKSTSCATLGLDEDARFLETRIGTNFGRRPDTETTLRIQPRAGRLLIFFSRDDQGQEDPRTWHAGERIRAGPGGVVTEKRILTLFKEVDYEGAPGFASSSSSSLSMNKVECTFESYLAPFVRKQRKWLQAKALLQEPTGSVLQKYGGNSQT